MTRTTVQYFEHAFETESLDETQALAERLGRVLAGGDVVALAGALGAGKTAFVQGLARGLAVTSPRVASPSFTIVNEHAGRVPLFHVDLYRIGDALELEEIGFRDYFARGGVVAVEWFDRAPELLPDERLELLLIARSPTTRRIEARGWGAVAVARLRAWME
jgi:tRNA threonylcarbamoyladenosine biosynthesis protein TsaE